MSVTSQQNPTMGQAYTIPCSFRDTSGNLITGWTSAVANVTTNGGASTSATIAESPLSGWGTIQLTAAQMSGTIIGVVATCSNANMTAFVATILPADMTEYVNGWDEQSALKMETVIMQVAAAVLNGKTQTGSTTQVFKRDGVTQMLSGTYSEGDIQAVKTKLT